MARYGGRQKASRTAAAADDDQRKVIVTARLPPHLRHKLYRAAEALDISASALIGELVERLEVDASGAPPWQSKYAPSGDTQEHLELSA